MVRLIVVQRLGQYLNLMTDARFVESCTGSYTISKGDIAEETHPDAGGRGVGNAHLSDAEHVAASAMHSSASEAPIAMACSYSVSLMAGS